MLLSDLFSALTRFRALVFMLCLLPALPALADDGSGSPWNIALYGLDIFSPLIALLLGWVGTQLARLIGAHIKQTYLRNVLTRLNDSVWTVVKELQQTVVADIKAASADGSLSEADRAQVKAKALAYLKSYLGPAGMAELGRVLGLKDMGLNHFLDSKIEAAVHDLKASTAARPSLEIHALKVAPHSPFGQAVKS